MANTISSLVVGAFTGAIGFLIAFVFARSWLQAFVFVKLAIFTEALVLVVLVNPLHLNPFKDTLDLLGVATYLVANLVMTLFLFVITWKPE